MYQGDIMLVRRDKRHTLFLQGTGSLFFARLAEKLRRAEVKTSKIHLCFGDKIFWRGGNSVNYHGSRNDWPAFLSDYILENGVTDIVLFSDARPYHAAAGKIAKNLGVNVFVFENGYFRPSWITMEQGGVNGRSSFPVDPEDIRELCKQAATSTQDFAGGSPATPMRLYFGDTTYHAINFLFGFTFPQYKGFRPVSALAEAGGWIKKALARPGKMARSRKAVDRLLDSKSQIFFFPLQLEHDFQLKVDSPFDSIFEAAEMVIASFAGNAGDDAVLLVKNHPLDNNTIDREAQITELARRHGVGDRVIFAEIGHNPSILKRSTGMVTINSTLGTAALYHGVPMCVLGDAVYNVKGLIHDGNLDSFWQTPQPFDHEFSLVFRQALIYHCQIDGHYCETSGNAGVFEHCAAKILSTSHAAPRKKARVGAREPARRPNAKVLAELNEKTKSN